MTKFLIVLIIISCVLIGYVSGQFVTWTPVYPYLDRPTYQYQIEKPEYFVSQQETPYAIIKQSQDQLFSLRYILQEEINQTEQGTEFIALLRQIANNTNHVPGDMNGDRIVNLLDVPLFVTMLEQNTEME